MYVRSGKSERWAPGGSVYGATALAGTPEAGDSSTQTIGAHQPEAPDATRSLVGQTISHYRILARLGTGGMGVIYRAQDVRLHRHVAVKFPSTELQTYPVVNEWLRREAHAGSALNHPNVCAVYDLGDYEGRPFIVMELLQGRTLRQQIHERCDLEPFLDLSIQIAGGLNAVHSVGIVHRDIKPSNIFVTASGQAKVFDFGLAIMPNAEVMATAASGGGTRLCNRLEAFGRLQGTPGYMSPEQMRCERVDVRSDLFSLGAVYYEMLTAKRAFRATTASAVAEAVLNRPLVPIRRRRPELPCPVARLVEKILEKD